jgi:hypothetical protein
MPPIMKFNNRYRRSVSPNNTIVLSKKILRRIEDSLVEREQRQYYLAVVVQRVNEFRASMTLKSNLSPDPLPNN